uniref:FA core complex associated protein 20 n=1 Tax=Prolemur simus TaxID=1328070 RepID=A0A8C9DMM2_PROSS
MGPGGFVRGSQSGRSPCRPWAGGRGLKAGLPERGTGPVPRAGVTPLQHLSPPQKAPQGGCPWLLRGGGSESERLWAELLRTVSPDLTLDAELPPLPARPGQRAATPEVFTVGPKTFSWTPFPPAPGGPGRSYGPVRGAGGCPESPTRSPQVRPAPEPCGTPSVEERPAVEGALALQSCPMCQQEFAPGLTQLDVDSHLAQCLAESTEDVAW